MPDSSDYQKRLELVRRLNNLPDPQLGQLIFIISPPPGNVPPPTAAPSARIEALLTWANHPTMGCGLEALEQVLNGIDHAKPTVTIQDKDTGISANSSILRKYEQAVAQQAEEGYGLISDRGQLFLNSLQDHLSIAPEDAQRIESDCLSPYASYEDLVRGLLKQGYPFDEEAKGILQRSQDFLKLKQEATAQIEKRVLWGDDVLSTERGIDFIKLRDMLKAQDWKAADRETYNVMIRAVGKQWGDWFTDAELLHFPCTDLLTIDRLWVKYSQGRFGFSVQKQIYVECGANLDGKYPGDTLWKKFVDKVGWRVNGSWIGYSKVTFSTSAFQGHLPAAPRWVGGWFVVTLFTRLEVGL